MARIVASCVGLIGTTNDDDDEKQKPKYKSHLWNDNKKEFATKKLEDLR